MLLSVIKHCKVKACCLVHASFCPSQNYHHYYNYYNDYDNYHHSYGFNYGDHHAKHLSLPTINKALRLLFSF